jgi:hypothetical protein
MDWRMMQVKQISIVHQSVVCRRAMLCEIVSKIIGAFVPMYNKLMLCNMVTDPIEVHVNSFIPTLFDCSMGYTSRKGAIRFDGSWWIGMSLILKDGARPSNFFSIVEQGIKFSFSCKGDKQLSLWCMVHACSH